MSDRGTLRYPSKRAAACTGLKLKVGHESETSGDHIQGQLHGHVTHAVTQGPKIGTHTLDTLGLMLSCYCLEVLNNS